MEPRRTKFCEARLNASAKLWWVDRISWKGPIMMKASFALLPIAALGIASMLLFPVSAFARSSDAAAAKEQQMMDEKGWRHGRYC